MNIGIYIAVVLAILLIGWLIVFLFDYLLARGAFRLIVGKAKENLDVDKLKEMFQKYMENRRQKWAFKTYMGVVTLIIGGGVVDSLSLKHFDGQCLETVSQAIDKVESIFRQAIIDKKVNYDDYDYSNIQSDLGKIRVHVENDWIQSIKGQSLIVYGKGGYGKTHLLASWFNAE